MPETPAAVESQPKSCGYEALPACGRQEKVGYFRNYPDTNVFLYNCYRRAPW